MRRLATPAALALMFLASTVPAATITPKIIGGDPAGNGEYPFAAALVYPVTLSPQSNPTLYASDYQAQFCGGSLVAPRWVLTAAHCITATNGSVKPAGQVQVITGITTLSNDAATAAPRSVVTAIVRHPQYNTTTLANDIALLYLSAPVTIDTGTFALATPSLLTALALGDDLTAIGWGVVDQNGSIDRNDWTFDPSLQEAQLDYIPVATCNSTTYYNGELASGMLCAGYLANPPRDTCAGDSGGPLLYADAGGWRQLGVTSFGAATLCAEPNSPGVYADVASYYNFISGATGTQPNLAVTAATVSGTQAGNTVTVRVTTGNQSPANSATGVALNLTFSGAVTVTNLGTLTGCTAVTGGVDCDLGTLAPGGSAVREFALAFTGTGVFGVTAAASSTAGDYDAANNTATRSYTVGAAPTGGGGGGGTGPLWLLVLALAGLRRHASHHPLRLR